MNALFDIAAQGKTRDQVEKDLGVLATLTIESKPFSDLLTNPLLTRDEQAQALEPVLTSIKAHEVTKRFVALLAVRKRLPLLPEVAEIFARRVAEARGEIKAEVISAKPLSLKDVAVITENLSKAYGKKVTVETGKNPDLLGGMVIRIGSKQLDASFAGKLNRLKHKLKAA